MPQSPKTSSKVCTFNKYDLLLRWPRIWIVILGILLIFLCFCIAGMEVGHTIYDFRRSTAFGGFILFFPLLICGIFVLITAFKPRLTLVRIATILCFIMIILCLALIAYDILVIYDPTRCFFLDCSYAVVNATNSTTNVTVTGWPIYVNWPNYFIINMYAKRIFQSVQIFLAALYILCSALYILTYFIYRKIQLHQKSIYTAEQRVSASHDQNNTPVATVTTNKHIIPTHYYPTATMYSIHRSVSPIVQTTNHASPSVKTIQNLTPRKTKKQTVIRRRAMSVTYERLCTRCMKEPRMHLTTNYERQNYFSHLCMNCNYELFYSRQKPTARQPANDRLWKP